MQFFHSDQPLWLPKGTIRALMIGGLTLTLAVILLVYAFKKEEIPATVEQIMASVLPALVLLIKEYISMRSTETNGNDQ